MRKKFLKVDSKTLVLIVSRDTLYARVYARIRVRNPDVIQITRCCYGSFIARQWIRWIEWNLTARKIDSIVAPETFHAGLSRNLFRPAIEFRGPEFQG